MTILWANNSNALLIEPPSEVITTGNTTTLLIVNPRPSDAGDYICTFDGLNLGRFIRLGRS